MSAYLIPSTPSIIEDVAIAICRNRMRADVDAEIRKVYGSGLDDNQVFDSKFESAFSAIWAGKSEYDEMKRQQYRADAVAAISAINLKLLIIE